MPGQDTAALLDNRLPRLRIEVPVYDRQRAADLTVGARSHSSDRASNGSIGTRARCASAARRPSSTSVPKWRCTSWLQHEKGNKHSGRWRLDGRDPSIRRWIPHPPERLPTSSIRVFTQRLSQNRKATPPGGISVLLLKADTASKSSACPSRANCRSRPIPPLATVAKVSQIVSFVPVADVRGWLDNSPALPPLRQRLGFAVFS
jgi:hypothetical protein